MISNSVLIPARELPPTVVRTQARKGVNYEKNFFKALESVLPPSMLFLHQPWFRYRTSGDRHCFCSPDGIVRDTTNEFALVFEVKLTWIPEAAEKLETLYCPVVSRALGIPARGIVVARNLIPDSPRPQPSLGFAMMTHNALYHWIGSGPIEW